MENVCLARTRDTGDISYTGEVYMVYMVDFPDRSKRKEAPCNMLTCMLQHKEAPFFYTAMAQRSFVLAC